MSVYRPEFEEALRLFAKVSQTVKDMGYPPPILVGGAAVELYSASAIAAISIEDLIADRMGQYDSGTALEMLKQAQMLFSLHPDADLDYMDRRIREETGNRYGAGALES